MYSLIDTLVGGSPIAFRSLPDNVPVGTLAGPRKGAFVAGENVCEAESGNGPEARPAPLVHIMGKTARIRCEMRPFEYTENTGFGNILDHELNRTVD